MADISKIKTLDGTTYNIKDASARSSIPAAATVAPKMDGTAAVGSSTKYAKEDHVHPSDTTKLNYDAALFTTNSFAPSETRSLYISQINNAFFALDKRYSVSVVYDGDPVSNVAQFFDGSYEGNNLRIQPGKSAVFTLDFSNGSGSKFAGYPYGYIYITFYASNIPASITGRVYNNYASQTIGWKTLTFEQFGTSMFRARQDYYGLQTLEITMVGSGDTPYGYTSPVEIEFHATRPDPVEHSSIITKYGAQKLYYPLTAPSFIGSLTGNASSATKATQDESGNNIKANYAASMSISGHTITLKNKNGTSLGTVTVPDDNTTYESKSAVSGGTDVSLVTTGEKYNWNTRGIPSGGSTGQILAKSSNTNYAAEWIGYSFDIDNNGYLNLIITN